MLALLAALREETSGLLRQMSLQETTTPRGWLLFKGRLDDRGVLLAQTGMGRERAERAAQFLLERYPVSCLVSFGFAGGLAPDLQIGDLVVCRELLGPDGLEAGRRHFSDPFLADMATEILEAIGACFSGGRGVTLEGVLYNPEEKRALGRSLGALAVDMESYWIAGVAAQWRVPFLAVRAVSDVVSESLPPLDRFVGPDGTPMWRDAARYFASHPVDLVKMPSVYRNARLAETSLTLFLRLLVSQVPLQGSGVDMEDGFRWVGSSR